MSVFDASLVLSTLLCSLVAGFLFAYSVVVMPGIKQLEDREFIRAFQVTDRIIQDNHPLFILVWIGSAIALIVCAVYGFGNLRGTDLMLLIVATAGYLMGVQATTIIIHLPLNNTLQKFDTDTMTAEELSKARKEFEPRWNKSNNMRATIACCISFLLIILVSSQ